jgi:hypothetical protein
LRKPGLKLFWLSPTGRYVYRGNGREVGESSKKREEKNTKRKKQQKKTKREEMRCASMGEVVLMVVVLTECMTFVAGVKMAVGFVKPVERSYFFDPSLGVMSEIPTAQAVMHFVPFDGNIGSGMTPTGGYSIVQHPGSLTQTSNVMEYAEAKAAGFKDASSINGEEGAPALICSGSAEGTTSLGSTAWCNGHGFSMPANICDNPDTIFDTLIKRKAKQWKLHPSSSIPVWYSLLTGGAITSKTIHTGEAIIPALLQGYGMKVARQTGCTPFNCNNHMCEHTELLLSNLPPVNCEFEPSNCVEKNDTLFDTHLASMHTYPEQLLVSNIDNMFGGFHSLCETGIKGLPLYLKESDLTCESIDINFLATAEYPQCLVRTSLGSLAAPTLPADIQTYVDDIWQDMQDNIDTGIVYAPIFEGDDWQQPGDIECRYKSLVWDDRSGDFQGLKATDFNWVIYAEFAGGNPAGGGCPSEVETHFNPISNQLTFVSEDGCSFEGEVQCDGRSAVNIRSDGGIEKTVFLSSYGPLRKGGKCSWTITRRDGTIVGRSEDYVGTHSCVPISAMASGDGVPDGLLDRFIYLGSDCAFTTGWFWLLFSMTLVFFLIYLAVTTVLAIPYANKLSDLPMISWLSGFAMATMAFTRSCCKNCAGCGRAMKSGSKEERFYYCLYPFRSCRTCCRMTWKDVGVALDDTKGFKNINKAMDLEAARDRNYRSERTPLNKRNDSGSDEEIGRLTPINKGKYNRRGSMTMLGMLGVISLASAAPVPVVHNETRRQLAGGSSPSPPWTLAANVHYHDHWAHGFWKLPNHPDFINGQVQAFVHNFMNFGVSAGTSTAGNSGFHMTSTDGEPIIPAYETTDSGFSCPPVCDNDHHVYKYAPTQTLSKYVAKTCEVDGQCISQCSQGKCLGEVQTVHANGTKRIVNHFSGIGSKISKFDELYLTNKMFERNAAFQRLNTSTNMVELILGEKTYFGDWTDIEFQKIVFGAMEDFLPKSQASGCVGIQVTGDGADCSRKGGGTTECKMGSGQIQCHQKAWQPLGVNFLGENLGLSVTFTTMQRVSASAEGIAGQTYVPENGLIRYKPKLVVGGVTNYMESISKYRCNDPSGTASRTAIAEAVAQVALGDKFFVVPGSGWMVYDSGNIVNTAVANCNWRPSVLLMAPHVYPEVITKTTCCDTMLWETDVLVRVSENHGTFEEKDYFMLINNFKPAETYTIGDGIELTMTTTTYMSAGDMNLPKYDVYTIAVPMGCDGTPGFTDEMWGALAVMTQSVDIDSDAYAELLQCGHNAKCQADVRAKYSCQGRQYGSVKVVPPWCGAGKRPDLIQITDAKKRFDMRCEDHGNGLSSNVAKKVEATAWSTADYHMKFAKIKGEGFLEVNCPLAYDPLNGMASFRCNPNAMPVEHCPSGLVCPASGLCNTMPPNGHNQTEDCAAMTMNFHMAYYMFFTGKCTIYSEKSADPVPSEYNLASPYLARVLPDNCVINTFSINENATGIPLAMVTWPPLPNKVATKKPTMFGSYMGDPEPCEAGRCPIVSEGDYSSTAQMSAESVTNVFVVPRSEAGSTLGAFMNTITCNDYLEAATKDAWNKAGCHLNRPMDIEGATRDTGGVNGVHWSAGTLFRRGVENQVISMGDGVLEEMYTNGVWETSEVFRTKVTCNDGYCNLDNGQKYGQWINPESEFCGFAEEVFGFWRQSEHESQLAMGCVAPTRTFEDPSGASSVIDHLAKTLGETDGYGSSVDLGRSVTVRAVHATAAGIILDTAAKIVASARSMIVLNFEGITRYSGFQSSSFLFTYQNKATMQNLKPFGDLIVHSVELEGCEQVASRKDSYTPVFIRLNVSSEKGENGVGTFYATDSTKTKRTEFGAELGGPVTAFVEEQWSLIKIPLHDITEGLYVETAKWTSDTFAFDISHCPEHLPGPEQHFVRDGGFSGPCSPTTPYNSSLLVIPESPEKCDGRRGGRIPGLMADDNGCYKNTFWAIDFMADDWSDCWKGFYDDFFSERMWDSFDWDCSDTFIIGDVCKLVNWVTQYGILMIVPLILFCCILYCVSGSASKILCSVFTIPIDCLGMCCKTKTKGITKRMSKPGYKWGSEALKQAGKPERYSKTPHESDRHDNEKEISMIKRVAGEEGVGSDSWTMYFEGKGVHFVLRIIVSFMPIVLILALQTLDFGPYAFWKNSKYFLLGLLTFSRLLGRYPGAMVGYTTTNPIYHFFIACFGGKMPPKDDTHYSIWDPEWMFGWCYEKRKMIREKHNYKGPEYGKCWIRNEPLGVTGSLLIAIIMELVRSVGAYTTVWWQLKTEVWSSWYGSLFMLVIYMATNWESLFGFYVMEGGYAKMRKQIRLVELGRYMGMVISFLLVINCINWQGIYEGEGRVIPMMEGKGARRQLMVPFASASFILEAEACLGFMITAATSLGVAKTGTKLSALISSMIRIGARPDTSIIVSRKVLTIQGAMRRKLRRNLSKYLIGQTRNLSYSFHRGNFDEKWEPLMQYNHHDATGIERVFFGCGPPSDSEVRSPRVIGVANMRGINGEIYLTSTNGIGAMIAIRVENGENSKALDQICWFHKMRPELNVGQKEKDKTLFCHELYNGIPNPPIVYDFNPEGGLSHLAEAGVKMDWTIVEDSWISMNSPLFSDKESMMAQSSKIPDTDGVFCPHQQLPNGESVVQKVKNMEAGENEICSWGVSVITSGVMIRREILEARFHSSFIEAAEATRNRGVAVGGEMIICKGGFYVCSVQVDGVSFCSHGYESRRDAVGEMTLFLSATANNSVLRDHSLDMMVEEGEPLLNVDCTTESMVGALLEKEKHINSCWQGSTNGSILMVVNTKNVDGRQTNTKMYKMATADYKSMRSLGVIRRSHVDSSATTYIRDNPHNENRIILGKDYVREKVWAVGTGGGLTKIRVGENFSTSEYNERDNFYFRTACTSEDAGPKVVNDDLVTVFTRWNERTITNEPFVLQEGGMNFLANWKPSVGHSVTCEAFKKMTERVGGVEENDLSQLFQSQQHMKMTWTTNLVGPGQSGVIGDYGIELSCVSPEPSTPLTDPMMELNNMYTAGRIPKPIILLNQEGEQIFRCNITVGTDQVQGEAKQSKKMAKTNAACKMMASMRAKKSKEEVPHPGPMVVIPPTKPSKDGVRRQGDIKERASLRYQVFAKQERFAASVSLSELEHPITPDPQSPKRDLTTYLGDNVEELELPDTSEMKFADIVLATVRAQGYQDPVYTYKSATALPTHGPDGERQSLIVATITVDKNGSPTHRCTGQAKMTRKGAENSAAGVLMKTLGLSSSVLSLPVPYQNSR